MASGVETCRTTSPGDQTRRSERGDVAVYVVHAYTQRLLRTERVSGRQQHRVSSVFPSHGSKIAPTWCSSPCLEFGRPGVLRTSPRLPLDLQSRCARFDHGLGLVCITSALLVHGAGYGASVWSGGCRAGWVPHGPVRQTASNGGLRQCIDRTCDTAP